MPRVASQPTTTSGRRTSRHHISATPSKQSPIKLALNDDRGEKAARLQSRQALQELQLNEIRAAATGSPMRKFNQSSYTRAGSESPQTPRIRQQQQQQGKTPGRKVPRNSAAEAAAAAVRRRISGAAGAGADAAASDGELNVVGGTSVTPMKRVPILANFEEWMKMATDNKINAANSWNFALIDYFHDMSLLKEGDGVNFQKASCTLDGCVKIYTSRVDSVATETGRLLSGLADSAEGKSKKGKEGRDGDEGEGEDDDEEDEDDDEDGEGGRKKKQRKKPARSHEATLAPSFASLQLKKLELEFAVDPLFKKASADFDEGGAKGLLLNHLSIDSEGRIVFDSSDDAGDASANSSTSVLQQQQHHHHHQQQQQQREGEDEETETETAISRADVTLTGPSEEAKGHDKEEKQAEADIEVDLASLGNKFFPDLSILDSQDICPSMKTFTLGSADLTIPFIKGPDKALESTTPPPADLNLNLAEQSGIFLNGSAALGFDGDDDDDIGGFDMPDDVGFGEGGEAWARDAAIEQQLRTVPADGFDDDINNNNNNGNYYTVNFEQHRFRSQDEEQENLLAYFDKAFNSRAKVGTKAFMTLENWRIQKLQKGRQGADGPAVEKRRKEKEPFEIDFTGPISDNLSQLLEAQPVSNSTISLPKAQWKTKGRNLLDRDDEQIDVRKLMRLWIKPKCRIGRRKDGTYEVRDEGYGARGMLQQAGGGGNDDDDDGEGRKGDYDANFFQDDDQMALPFDLPLPIDDDDDDDDNNENDNNGGMGFVDAREMLSPQPEEQGGQNGDQQGQLGIDNQLGGGGADGGSSSNDNNNIDANANANANANSNEQALLPGSFGTQLVTQQGKRLRPEYVNYARTAKKVDVRRLKEEMWRGMADEIMKGWNGKSHQQPQLASASAPQAQEQEQEQEQEAAAEAGDKMDVDVDPAGAPRELKFTEMISNLTKVYPEQQMKDISTSYCFICLLHLANEKGLVLEGGAAGQDQDQEAEAEAMTEIRVRRDMTVGEGYEGE